MDLAKLVVRLEAENKALTSTLESTTRRLQGFQRSTRTISSDIKSALAGLGVGFSTVAIVRSIKNVIDQADRLNKLSQSTGVAAEQLSALGYAAEFSDVSLDQLGETFRRLAVNQSDALRGTGEAVDAFKAIGVTADDLRTKSPDRLLKQIADKFAGYTDDANKAAIATRLFGRSGDALIPFLNQGARGIEALEAEGRQLGATFDGETARAAERFNDQMRSLSSSFTGFKIAVASDVLPALTAITTAIAEARKQGEGFKGFWDSLVRQGIAGPFGDPAAVTSLEALRKQMDVLLERRQELLQRKQEGGVVNWFADLFGVRDLNDVEYQIYVINRRMLELQKTMEPATGPSAPLLQAPEIKSTPKLTDAERDVARLTEAITRQNAQWQEGIITVEQYRDAVRSAADLPRNIPGLDALKPVDLSDQYAAQLSALADYLKTRDEIELEAFEARKRLVEENVADEESRRRVTEQLERLHAFNMVRIEEDKNQQIMAMREGVLGLTVELLANLGTRSKAFAKAAIVLEKADAIQRVLIQSKVAAMAALTPPPIGLGPVLGQGLSARILAMGGIQAGLIGAIGAVQLSNTGRESTSARGSGIGEPFSSPTAAPITSQQPQRVTQVVFSGPLVGISDTVKQEILQTIRQAVDNEDVVLISSTSRQARELAG